MGKEALVTLEDLNKKNAGFFKITSPNKRVTYTYNLSKWCRDNGVPYSNITASSGSLGYKAKRLNISAKQALHYLNKTSK